MPNSGLALCGMALTLVCQIVYLSYRLGQISIKVETLWDFIIRRAKAEFVQKGFGFINSPLQLSAESLAAIQPFVLRVVPFYVDLLKRRPDITEKELFLEFEQTFGDELIQTICIPYNLNAGACVILLIEGCKALCPKPPEAKPDGR